TRSTRDWSSDVCSSDLGIRARSSQSHRRSKGKSRKDDRQIELAIQPIQCRMHVIHFAYTLIVLSLAQPSSAEIEPQYGKSEAVRSEERRVGEEGRAGVA